jgi:hypothetical protein
MHDQQGIHDERIPETVVQKEPELPRVPNFAARILVLGVSLENQSSLLQARGSDFTNTVACVPRGLAKVLVVHLCGAASL